MVTSLPAVVHQASNAFPDEKGSLAVDATHTEAGDVVKEV
jgi:hypothetical protein